MYIHSKKLAILYKTLVALVGIVGIILQMGVADGRFNLNVFQYFTIQSSVVVAIYMIFSVVSLIKSKQSQTFTKYPVFMGVSLMGISLTMVVAFFLLSHAFSNVSASGKLSMTLLHEVLPILTIGNYILFEEKGKWKKKDPFLFCIFPLVYVTYALIAAQIGNGIGSLTGSKYPYPFLDMDALGVVPVLITCVIISLIYLLVGLVLYYIDLKLKKNS